MFAKALAAVFVLSVNLSVAISEEFSQSGCAADGTCEGEGDEAQNMSVKLLQRQGGAATLRHAMEEEQSLQTRRAELLAELAALDAELGGLETRNEAELKPSPLTCGPATGVCKRDLDWARYTGIRRHPEWYPGLKASSSANDFQNDLFKKGKCPLPCGYSAPQTPSPTPAGWQFETNVTMEPFIGMGYTPDPHKWAAHVACDDFMADWSQELWGTPGRNDLKVIKDMGATVVRTYGIGSQLDHKAFLDHAHSLGMKVMPGFADFPYMRTGSDCGQSRMWWMITGCLKDWRHNCHDTIKEQYKKMLENGYLVKGDDGKLRYHPALLTITLINECELKMYGYNTPNLGHDAWHAKVAVTATDGLLSAEDEMNIEGPKPLLTATVSLATCPQCKSVWMNMEGCHRNTPTLCTLYDYYNGFMDPKGFLGYDAKHDLKKMYATRWVNSYNTPRRAAEICERGSAWVKSYSKGPLGKVPLYIAEFHHSFLSPHQFGDDIKKARAITLGEDGNSCGVDRAPLIGFNIFEYGVAYWKGSGAEGGSAMRYGLWGIGWKWIGRTKAESGNPAQNVFCIFPARVGGGYAKKWDDTNAKRVIEALNGKWPESPVLCD